MPAESFDLSDINKPLLGQSLIEVASRNRPTQEWWSRARRIPADLTTIIKTLFPEAKLIPFGSSQQYLSTTDSDFDLYLRLPPASQQNALTAVHDLLRSFFPKGSLTLVTTARVPIIKYTPPPIHYTPHTAVHLAGPSGMEYQEESVGFILAGTSEEYAYPSGQYPWYPFGTAFDISLDTQGAVNTQLIRNYIIQCPVTAALCHLAKSLGKRTGIIDAKAGMLSSYAVTLLVLFYSVEKGLLSHVSTDATAASEVLEEMVPWREHEVPPPEVLAEHWFGFLDYYYRNITSKVVDLRDTRVPLLSKGGIKSWKIVQIIDPFEEDLNLGRGIGTVRAAYVKDALRKELSTITTSYKSPAYYLRRTQTEDTCANWLLLANSLRDCSDFEISERQALGIAAHTSPTQSQLCEVLMRLDALGTPYDVYPKVLELDSCNVVALFRRGLHLGKKGRNYFLEVLSQTTDPSICAAALGNVGLLMRDTDIVEVAGVAMSKRGILCKAVELNPCCIPLWKALCGAVSQDAEGDELTVGGVAYTRAALYAHAIELQISNGQICKSAAEEFLILAKHLSQTSTTAVISNKEVPLVAALKAVYKLTGKPAPNGVAQFTSTKPTDDLTTRVTEQLGEPFIKAKLSSIDRVTAMVACFDGCDQQAMGELEAIKARHPRLVVVTV
eukprot:TRINITY_DN33489_c0_g1_i1.p1 TRINITY_DN33489_c0_g1~~TRINITY_DN33489_c0_g1_i1.p1  ORF type:complete len:784 (+),score=192.96 TRINITY_DN33489_c0_g1_i1:346-2352(+)